MLQEVNLSDLEIGMYIVEIAQQKSNSRLRDPDWVKRQSTIKKLAENGVISVMVNPEKRKYVKSENHIKHLQHKSAFEDIDEASELFIESKSVQRKVFENIQNGLQIDVELVKAATDKSIDMLFKNPNAISCMLNIREKDEYLLEHSLGVAILTAMFARYLNLKKEVIQHMTVGAILHDVGKIDIPDNILHKPARLTHPEFDIMKKHIDHSITRLEKTPGLSKLALSTAALHHEKINGKGYPYGLSGEDIPLNGRIIGICDVFDALTATRCYKQGFTHTKAFTIVRKMAAEGDLDEVLVKKFIDCVGSYPVGAMVELTSDKLAIVDTRNIDDSTKPKVYTFYDLSSRKYSDVVRVDLAEKENIQIVKCIRAEEYGLNFREAIEHINTNKV